jgi:hypothetical protein
MKALDWREGLDSSSFERAGVNVLRDSRRRIAVDGLGDQT